MKTLIFPATSLVLLTITGCGAPTTLSSVSTPPQTLFDSSAIAEESIAPISADFPSIDDPANAFFYENHAKYQFGSDSEDRQSNLDVAYRAISIAIKLYRAGGKTEQLEDAIDIRQQIVAEQKSLGFR